MPVYDTVYRRATASFPDGYKVTYPKLGWFEAPESPAELPAAITEVSP